MSSASPRQAETEEDEEDLSTGVRLAFRIRPFLPREAGQKDGLRVGDRCVILADEKGQERVFGADAVFDSRNQLVGSEFSETLSLPGTATQAAVFEALGSHLVDHVVEGYNTCLMAYGHTGSGKTYTILGEDWSQSLGPATMSSGSMSRCNSLDRASLVSGIPRGAGLLPRTLDAVYAALRKGMQPEAVCVASFYEVHNERVRDLLAPNSFAEEPGHPRQGRRPQVHFHPRFGAFVSDITEVQCSTATEALQLVATGLPGRSTAPTALNERSSRSHAIFTLRIERSNTGNCLMLVDLAGREQERLTQCKTERFKELTLINRSLFHLARCVRNLAAQGAQGALMGSSNNPSHHFRNSKLTMILGHALAGNSYTTVVGTVSPALTSFEDTLATLRFCDSVKQVRTRPVLPTAHREDVVHELQDEVKRLESELAHARTGHEQMHKQLREAEAMMQHYRTSWQEALERSSEELSRLRDEAHAAIHRNGTGFTPKNPATSAEDPSGRNLSPVRRVSATVPVLTHMLPAPGPPLQIATAPCFTVSPPPTPLPPRQSIPPLSTPKQVVIHGSSPDLRSIAGFAASSPTRLISGQHRLPFGASSPHTSPRPGVTPVMSPSTPLAVTAPLTSIRRSQTEACPSRQTSVAASIMGSQLLTSVQTLAPGSTLQATPSLASTHSHAEANDLYLHRDGMAEDTDIAHTSIGSSTIREEWSRPVSKSLMDGVIGESTTASEESTPRRGVAASRSSHGLPVGLQKAGLPDDASQATGPSPDFGRVVDEELMRVVDFWIGAVESSPTKSTDPRRAELITTLHQLRSQLDDLCTTLERGGGPVQPRKSVAPSKAGGPMSTVSPMASSRSASAWQLRTPRATMGQPRGGVSADRSIERAAERAKQKGEDLRVAAATVSMLRKLGKRQERLRRSTSSPNPRGDECATLIGSLISEALREPGDEWSSWLRRIADARDLRGMENSVSPEQATAQAIAAAVAAAAATATKTMGNVQPPLPETTAAPPGPLPFGEPRAAVTSRPVSRPSAAWGATPPLTPRTGGASAASQTAGSNPASLSAVAFSRLASVPVLHPPAAAAPTVCPPPIAAAPAQVPRLQLRQRVGPEASPRLRHAALSPPAPPQVSRATIASDSRGYVSAAPGVVLRPPGGKSGSLPVHVQHPDVQKADTGAREFVLPPAQVLTSPDRTSPRQPVSAHTVRVIRPER